MQLSVGDGIKAVHAIAETVSKQSQEPDFSNTSRNATKPKSVMHGNETSPTVSKVSDRLTKMHISEDQRLHVLIIDADAGDARCAINVDFLVCAYLHKPKHWIMMSRSFHGSFSRSCFS